MIIYNMQSKSGRPVPNQFIINTGKEFIFKSYKTFVAVYNRSDGKVYLTKEYFSKTTQRYLNLFLASLQGAEQIELTTDEISQMIEGKL